MNPTVDEKFISEYSPLVTDNICMANDVDPQDQKARAVLAYNLFNPDSPIQDNKVTLKLVENNPHWGDFKPIIRVFDSSVTYKDYYGEDNDDSTDITLQVTPGQKIVLYRMYEGPSYLNESRLVKHATMACYIDNDGHQHTNRNKASMYIKVPITAQGEATLRYRAISTFSLLLDYNSKKTTGWIKSEDCYPIELPSINFRSTRCISKYPVINKLFTKDDYESITQNFHIYPDNINTKPNYFAKDHLGKIIDWSDLEKCRSCDSFYVAPGQLITFTGINPKYQHGEYYNGVYYKDSNDTLIDLNTTDTVAIKVPETAAGLATLHLDLSKQNKLILDYSRDKKGWLDSEECYPFIYKD